MTQGFIAGVGEPAVRDAEGQVGISQGPKAFGNTLHGRARLDSQVADLHCRNAVREMDQVLEACAPAEDFMPAKVGSLEVGVRGVALHGRSP